MAFSFRGENKGGSQQKLLTTPQRTEILCARTNSQSVKTIQVEVDDGPCFVFLGFLTFENYNKLFDHCDGEWPN